MTRLKRFPLTSEQAERFLRHEDWKTFEISKDEWPSILGQHRIGDTFACMGSADPHDPRMLNMIKQCVAGVDQLVREPRLKPGEPEGNAYHYVIQETGHDRYPYVLIGPLYDETRVSHHFDADALGAYFDEPGTSSG